jgi:hypothetical protein
VRRSALAATLALLQSLASTAGAAEDGAAGARDVRGAVPIVAYSYSAFGVPAGTVGGQAYGLALLGSGQASAGGGGGMVWGSPVERLTLIGDAALDPTGRFAPSAAALVRVFGDPQRGWSFGALGRVERAGFGLEPTRTRDSPDELEPELDTGVLLSYAEYGWHADVNAIAGYGTGDDADVDGEGRLRLARDLGRWVRLGVDGQARARLTGPKTLLGGRTWDFAGGLQLLVGTGHVFGAMTTGPTTMNLPHGVGVSSVLSVGASTF